MRKSGATSYKETCFGIIPRSRLIKLEAEGVQRGLKYLQSLVKSSSLLEITPELIKSVHKKSFAWIFPKWAGKFRKIQVTYSGKEAPLYFKVPELTLNLCRDLKERLKFIPAKNQEIYLKEAVRLLAWWQYQFVSIHPFNDYNGRAARMLTALILVRLNLPPFEIKAETGKDRKVYIQAMQKADEGDLTSLEKLLAKALEEALSKYHEL